MGRLKLKLSAPFEISPRLLAGLRVGGAWVQLEYAPAAQVPLYTGGRTYYRWTIDLPGSKRGVCGCDLGSGAGGGNLQQGFGSLLSFLGACGEAVYWASRRPNERRGENADLFPKRVGEWAAGCQDELAVLAEEIERPGVVLIEED